MTPTRRRIGRRSRTMVRKEKRFFVSREVWLVITDLFLRSGQYFEHPVPAEFGKLSDVRMEHVHAWVFVREFENAALCLTLNNGIRKLSRSKAGAGRIVVEKVG